MFSVSDYETVSNGNTHFYVMSNDTPPPCPDCRGTLFYRDRKPRVMKSEGGEKQWLMIRRFRCCRCRKLHNELPDCLTAFKHYKTEVIAGVVDGIVTSDDLDSENYPCVSTMLLWLRWFQLNLERMEGYLRMAAYELSDYNPQTLFAKVSLLDSLRKNSQRWLEKTLRTIYNNGGFLPPYRR